MAYCFLCFMLILCFLTVTWSIQCQNTAPGLNILRRGVDVTTLDLLPQNFNDDRGYKKPIFDFTCNDSKKLNEHDLPDQIWDVSNVPGGWLIEEVKIMKSYNEVKRQKASSTGINISILKGAFSASKSYKESQHTIMNTSQYLEEVSAYDSAFRADLLPSWALRLNRFAQQFINNWLPESYEANRESYNRFVNFFGTHYFQNANFGGIINVHISTDRSYFYQKTDREVSAQAKASYLKFLSLKGGYSGAISTVDQKFEQSSIKQIRYYGGETNLLSSSGISTWQTTVADNPWLFAGDLVSISSLLQNENKKKAMDRAIAFHVNIAYLKEAQRILRAVKTRYDVGTEQVNELQQQIQSALTQIEPTQETVEAISTSIDREIIVPSWFIDKTMLCYRWYPDGDGGQCGGGASRLLCAKPGDMTNYYRDDTDKRGGGCRMSWSITTSGEPSWFRQVKICYRWYPDGDGGQCGGGVGRQLCASVKKWTTYYRDDTDRRGGGCQMSWMLQIPDSAPLWLKNAKLCYYWYADGDGGQCGGGVDQHLCAVANSWTTYYRDDTDRRSGGCQMSWGIKLA
ncbi:perivitellin-2 67 kDa subunit-like [Limulus polyphemus]|uniref:Perivitellin-2 67 kDa subunit-like n=1 Tax=Limulus polyphemus TaxID=6850 RepID=A0ABM1BR88_LIMPO|nr:perivitellin-2 67 kDa subunit-like [Limulus polyphemus]